MSLLIKALNKAEEAQVQNAKTEQLQSESIKAQQAEAKSSEMELSLSPTESTFSEPITKSISKQQTLPTSNRQSSSQAEIQNMAAKSAANVFTAKGLEAKNDSTRLVLIAGTGLIALLGMGLYFYQFVDNTPPIVVPPRPSDQTATVENAAQTSAESTLAPEPNDMEVVSVPAVVEPVGTKPRLVEAIQTTENLKLTSNKKSKKAARVEDETDFAQPGDVADVDAEPSIEEVNADEATADKLTASFSANKTNKNTRKSKNNSVIASDSASIQISKSVPEPNVNPILMSAYEAYNTGNDVQAQKLYKQVLKRDIGNIDALLGLGSIAIRQGRSADANSWYSKVLELDPRNNIAQAAILDSQSQGNELANETSLKNMLAKQPNDANLHVALGNLYAEQNLWSAAQQAYFDAYSLNKTADNAYNLAVSLDQMGKPKLALPYYQQALDRASNTSNIDKAALEARIAAIK